MKHTIIVITLSLLLISCGGTTENNASIDTMNVHMCLMGSGEDCTRILDPENADTYQEIIQGECNKMPSMKACNTYFNTLKNTSNN